MQTAPNDWLLRSRLNPRQLSLLVHLDEKRSILRAAEAAHMTQPAASKLLSSLESALEVPLFTRHARGVEPTTYGEILIRHARGALAALSQAHEELAAARSGLTGEVSIGTVTSATTLVPAAVAALKRDYPGIRVNIDLDFSESLLAGLHQRKYDMVIARLHGSRGLNLLQFEVLDEVPHSVAVRADHPLLRKRGLTMRDLVRRTWILPPSGNVLRNSLEELFLRQHAQFPQSVVETAGLPIIINLLRASDMIAPLATPIVEPYCETKVLAILPLTLDLRLGAAGIITRRDQQRSPAAKVMLDTLRHAAKLQSGPSTTKVRRKIGNRK